MWSSCLIPARQSLDRPVEAPRDASEPFLVPLRPRRTKQPSGSAPSKAGHLRVHRDPSGHVCGDAALCALWRDARGLLCVAAARRESARGAGPATDPAHHRAVSTAPWAVWQSTDLLDAAGLRTRVARVYRSNPALHRFYEQPPNRLPRGGPIRCGWATSHRFSSPPAGGSSRWSWISVRAGFSRGAWARGAMRA